MACQAPFSPWFRSVPSAAPPYICYVTLPGGSCFGSYGVSNVKFCVNLSLAPNVLLEDWWPMMTIPTLFALQRPERHQMTRRTRTTSKSTKMKYSGVRRFPSEFQWSEMNYQRLTRTERQKDDEFDTKAYQELNMVSNDIYHNENQKLFTINSKKWYNNPCIGASFIWTKTFLLASFHLWSWPDVNRLIPHGPTSSTAHRQALIQKPFMAIHNFTEFTLNQRCVKFPQKVQNHKRP